MHELMVTCQELVKEDVDELVSGYTQPLPLPIGPPSAVAEPATKTRRLQRRMSGPGRQTRRRNLRSDALGVPTV